MARTHCPPNIGLYGIELLAATGVVVDEGLKLALDEISRLNQHPTYLQAACASAASAKQEGSRAWIEDGPSGRILRYLDAAGGRGAARVLRLPGLTPAG